jgi:hypothetical protein
MAMFGYRYELRRGEEVVATGHLSLDRVLEVRERVHVVGREGIVRVDELRLVVQLVRESE